VKKIGILLNLIILLNCNGGTVVGSDNVNVIDYVEFSQITTSNNGNNLEVSGHVINISETKNISSQWYIECQFYATENKTLKIGGDNTQINVPLDPGQETIWTIHWNPENNLNINLDDYPNFTFDDLRAYKK